MVPLDEGWFFLEDFRETTPRPEILILNLHSRKLRRLEKYAWLLAALLAVEFFPLIKVSSNVKINSEYYIEQVLKPLLETENSIQGSSTEFSFIMMQRHPTHHRNSPVHR